MDKFLVALIAAAISILVVAVIALVVAFPTMMLWNWLMPELFGLKAVTFWQALGLNLLTGILFKNGGGASASSTSNSNRR